MSSTSPPLEKRPSVVDMLSEEKHHIPVLRKTKIVATLGPASFDRIDELIKAGVNMFRINFSHAKHEGTDKLIEKIRATASELNSNVAILGDLCGPKVRVGEFENHEPIELVNGEEVTIKYSTQPGRAGMIHTPIKNVFGPLEPGHRILFDDGKMKVIVQERVSDTEVRCKVVVGGTLKERKGINLPDIYLDISALTDKDRKDAEFILKHRLDYMALSFVQRPKDIQDLRDLIEAHAPEEAKKKNAEYFEKDWAPRIIAKIERPQALTDFAAILDATDGVMVARGDLGVEIDLAEVPLAQKRIISMTKAKGKVVITATQMLESMTDAPVPTRAEVSDVANAVFDGTDAVMLSGESASGQYPIIAVDTMHRICLGAEKDLKYQSRELENRPGGLQQNKAIADAAVTASQEAEAPIVVYSKGGNMAARISQRKPPRRIVVATHEPRVARRLELLWGVYTVLIQPAIHSDEVIATAEKAIKERGWLTEGEHIVFVTGHHPHVPGLNCTLRLTRFGEALHSQASLALWHDAVKRLQEHMKKSS